MSLVGGGGTGLVWWRQGAGDQDAVLRRLFLKLIKQLSVFVHSRLFSRAPVVFLVSSRLLGHFFFFRD